MSQRRIIRRIRAARTSFARVLVLALMLMGALAAPVAAEPVDLERLTVAQRRADAGGRADERRAHAGYLDRIAALNSRGPGLNAVRRLNPDALAEAAAADEQRARAHVSARCWDPGAGQGQLDVAGMPTTAGAVALERSIAPETPRSPRACSRLAP